MNNIHDCIRANCNFIVKLVLLALVTHFIYTLTRTKDTCDLGAEIISTVLGTPSELKWSALNPACGSFDKRNPG